MEYRNFGRTGMKVSPLCLGCWNFGMRTSPEDSYAIVDRALDAGLNFLDTANVYGWGRSEEITGEALKRNGSRSRIVLATKFHGRMDDDDPNAAGASRRHIIEQCEASLKRLQTDYIDIYQIHRPRPDTAIDETLRALDDLVRAGKVRYLGSSTFAAWQFVESLWVAKELGLNRFVSEQPPYHILARRIERGLVPVALTYGVGLNPWSPLAGGLLTGKYTRGGVAPAGTRYAKPEDVPPQLRRLNETVYDVNEGLLPLAEAKGCTVSQLSLAWCIHQPGITSPILGPRTMDHLEDNLGALDVTVTDEDRQRIDELVPPGRMVSPFYEADFGPSQYRSFV
ncbi:MAG: aldo/keto reductase [Caldilineaceae bacterium SB0675_bin_29]|uniref:Aldo/keto reductase n=1 Tax=Caldilineaceae bacterium SB0675_bin_29 TaxID=2605266 RepID=A0A6B1G1K1_9CHLR|nr:aldo/keto reductase [Caldilineaceae bacterium SB0675_bin_29]